MDGRKINTIEYAVNIFKRKWTGYKKMKKKRELSNDPERLAKYEDGNGGRKAGTAQQQYEALYQLRNEVDDELQQEIASAQRPLVPSASAAASDDEAAEDDRT